MFVSVIICTYGRAGSLSALLDCLSRQTSGNFEVLLVDGNEAGSPARAAIVSLVSRFQGAFLRVEHSPRGLTRQRNLGIRASRGDLIVFLDDDVTIEPDFAERLARVFSRADMADVGGMTGYDVLTYGHRLAGRWRIRKALGAIPSLEPGDIDHLGRAVPVSFVPPFSGFKQIGWLPGFCMIYRRAAIQGIEFDEHLPTYGGEDRDFSTRVGRNWRLLFWGDLRLKHHGSFEGRDSDVYRMFQNSFGAGRRFAKGVSGFPDYMVLARTAIGDVVVDLLSFLSHPTPSRLQIPVARIRGLLQGLRSLRPNGVPARETESTRPEHLVANQ